MTCFMTCGVVEEAGEERKRTCRVTVRQIVNMIRQTKTCSMYCSGEEKKRDRKRLCFVTMMISIRERFRNRGRGE